VAIASGYRDSSGNVRRCTRELVRSSVRATAPLYQRAGEKFQCLLQRR
jgi:hypothetical protein